MLQAKIRPPVPEAQRRTSASGPVEPKTVLALDPAPGQFTRVYCSALPRDSRYWTTVDQVVPSLTIGSAHLFAVQRKLLGAELRVEGGAGVGAI